jgi:hypothetical protein
MEDGPEPEFKIGQLVVTTSIRKELSFRIVSVQRGDAGWSSGSNSKNAAAVRMIRELIPMRSVRESCT